ncbi:MAG: hypothetical protein R2748_00670 [Bryobacterales bacterium]
MRGVDLQRLAVRQHSGAANQRNVVVVDDVEILVEDLRDARAVYDRASALMGSKAGKRAKAAAQAMHFDAGRFLQWVRLLGPAHHVVGVSIVNDGDTMAALRQTMAKAADKRRIAAEMIRRVEGRHHGEP